MFCFCLQPLYCIFRTTVTHDKNLPLNPLQILTKTPRFRKTFLHWVEDYSPQRPNDFDQNEKRQFIGLLELYFGKQEKLSLDQFKESLSRFSYWKKAYTANVKKKDAARKEESIIQVVKKTLKKK